MSASHNTSPAEIILLEDDELPSSLPPNTPVRRVSETELYTILWARADWAIKATQRLNREKDAEYKNSAQSKQDLKRVDDLISKTAGLLEQKVKENNNTLADTKATFFCDQGLRTSIREYIENIIKLFIKYSKDHSEKQDPLKVNIPLHFISMLPFARAYISIYCRNSGEKVNSNTVLNLLITAINLAQKVLVDCRFNNKALATCGNITVTKLNMMEREMIAQLRTDTHSIMKLHHEKLYKNAKEWWNEASQNDYDFNYDDEVKKILADEAKDPLKQEKETRAREAAKQQHQKIMNDLAKNAKVKIVEKAKKIEQDNKDQGISVPTVKYQVTGSSWYQLNKSVMFQALPDETFLTVGEPEINTATTNLNENHSRCSIC